LIVFCNYV